MRKISNPATFTFFIIGLIFIACKSTYQLTDISENKAKDFVQNWPVKPKEVANQMISKYGAPDEVTNNVLIWYNNGSWKRTILYKEEVPHDFPKPHTDLLEQFIDYRVPEGKFDELAKYDGSVIAERTKGEISARCDKEEMNFLALNLANDIAIGIKTVQQARDYYVTAVKAFMKGEMDP